MLSLITPTRNRAEAFSLLQQWMAAQNYAKPYQWLVVNDGTEPYEYQMGQEVLSRIPDQEVGPTLEANLLHALPYVRGDKVLIVEDDDYYHPDYLEYMDRMLDRYALVGEGGAAYYNVRTRRYTHVPNRTHASLAQTGLRASDLHALVEVCGKGERFIDRLLWDRFRDLRHIFIGKRLHISIKGMPGEPGIGDGHGTDEGSPDDNLAVFRAWKIPSVYERYHRPVERNGSPARDAAVGGAQPVEVTDPPSAGRWDLIAPLGTGNQPKRFEGRCQPKPWEYRVTAVIPHLNTPGPLRWVVETLRSQTEKPYILVIDTGSDESTCRALEARRAEDLEIHYLRSHAWTHASEPVAIAMDVAFSLVRTDYVYCSHADCFVRRRDWLEWLLERCSPETPAVGYQMSDRSWVTRDWEWMVSHTATMLHMPTMRRIGASWSFHTFRALRAVFHSDNPDWMDTETGFNWSLRRAGIVPVLLGPEVNYERQIDENIDHVRSFPSATLYRVGPPAYRSGREGWMDSAIREARERVRCWREQTSNTATTEPDLRSAPIDPQPE